MSARSAPQILSMKDECVSLFSNFLIIGLCSFSDHPLLNRILFLIPPRDVFYQKNH